MSEHLELHVMLPQVAHWARSLTGADCGVAATLCEAGDVEDLAVSGLDADERRTLLNSPALGAFLKFLAGLEEPLRGRDFAAVAASGGFGGLPLLVRGFMGVAVRAGDRRLGLAVVGAGETGRQFTGSDEMVLAALADEASTAVVNARRFGDEQRARSHLEALVDTSPVGVVVLDPRTWRTVTVNHEARRIFGVPPQDPDIVSHMRRLRFWNLDGSEVSVDELAVGRVARTGEAVRAEPRVIERASGERVTALINATAIRSVAGEVESIVATMQDLTPLEELERLRAEFLGLVSDELRAPLASIKGSAATALGASLGLDSGEARQFFRIIDDQADHMRGLIDDLVDLTRLETGNLPLALERVDMSAVIDQAKNAYWGRAHPCGIEVGPMLRMPLVWADSRRLVQVLYSLLVAAARLSRPWSTITVSACGHDSHVAVSVSFDGAEIAAEHLPSLFSKFFAVSDAASDQRPSGHGLGLAICKGIVEAHGGRIWARSSVQDERIEVAFTIPAATEAADRAPAGDDAAPATSTPPRAPPRAERILVVDNDPQALHYLRAALTAGGFRPVVTGDPDKVEHLLEAETPDLVLLNLVLHGSGGLELMKQIPGLAEVPVIVLSGRGSDRFVEDAFETGAADYILKPFSPTELLARIRAAIRRQASSRHAQPYRCGELVLDYLTQRVAVAGRAVSLTPTQYRVLAELCKNAGRELTYGELSQRVWGTAALPDEQRLRTVVKDLRHKLGDNARNPRYIFTASGVGYRAGPPLHC